MSDAHLLPPNATPLERAMAKAGRLRHTPEVIRTLWSPWDCPLPMLPWLAWAWSVDEWDLAWTESQQRAMVAASMRLHQKKGTTWAVREALLRSGLESVRVIEHPEGAHWAEFDVDVAVVDRPLTLAAMERAAALIQEYKRQACVLRTLRTSLQSRGAMYYAMHLVSGAVTTVYPLRVESIKPSPIAMHLAFGQHSAQTTTVYPMDAP